MRIMVSNYQFHSDLFSTKRIQRGVEHSNGNVKALKLSWTYMSVSNFHLVYVSGV